MKITISIFIKKALKDTFLVLFINLVLNQQLEVFYNGINKTLF
jgi:hypothetical protein